VGVGVSATTEAVPQSAAAPSPFPPIADYELGAVNPALTAMANALGVGYHLLTRLGSPRGARKTVVAA